MHILQFTTEGESIYKDTQNARNTQITLCRWKESGTCPSGTDEPPGKATFNATLRCKIVAGQAAHKLAYALPADIRGSGHGQQSVAPLVGRLSLCTSCGSFSWPANGDFLRQSLGKLRYLARRSVSLNPQGRRHGRLEIAPASQLITKEIAPYQKPKRWGIGLQAGYGVALHDGQIRPAPFIGVGLNWNFLQF